MSKYQTVKLVTNWNGCGKRPPLSKLKHYSGNYLQRLRITMKSVGAPRLYSNPAHLDYKSEALPFESRSFCLQTNSLPSEEFLGGGRGGRGKKCTAITSLIECGIVLVWNLGAFISKMLYLRGCLNTIFQQHPLVQLNSLISDRSQLTLSRIQRIYILYKYSVRTTQEESGLRSDRPPLSGKQLLFIVGIIWNRYTICTMWTNTEFLVLTMAVHILTTKL